MSKKVNQNGVRIEDLSSCHKSFTKVSCIPNDITQEEAIDWKRQHLEALKDDMLFSSIIPIDVGISGCWLANRLRKLGTDEKTIENINFNLGRRAMFDRKGCWKQATEMYTYIQKQMKDTTVQSEDDK